MITVRELIEQLRQMPKNAIVILQKDSEGNGYSPCVGAETGIYREENSWSGEFYGPECLEDPELYGLEEEDIKDSIEAVVLWPTN